MVDLAGSPAVFVGGDGVFVRCQALGRKKPYSLTWTITPTNPSQSAKFAVSSDGFPASGTGPNLLHTSLNAYYAVINSTPSLSGGASQSRPWTLRSSQPIGEKSNGARYVWPSRISSARSRALSPLRHAASRRASWAPTARYARSWETSPSGLGHCSRPGTTTFSSADPALGTISSWQATIPRCWVPPRGGGPGSMASRCSPPAGPLTP